MVFSIGSHYWFYSQKETTKNIELEHHIDLLKKDLEHIKEKADSLEYSTPTVSFAASFKVKLWLFSMVFSIGSHYWFYSIHYNIT
jgi:hypothetical protein